MNHVAEPDRFLRRAMQRAETIEPKFTATLDGKVYLTSNEPRFWKLELTDELLDAMAAIRRRRQLAQLDEVSDELEEERRLSRVTSKTFDDTVP